jgi:hypothetical protein
MRPEITSWPPIHNRKPTAEKTMKITVVVITARQPVRATAASKARSVASPKRWPARSSWVKACTVRTASSVSPPSDTMSATRAWASRDSRRTLRPKITIGATTAGTTASTSSASSGLVTTSMTMPPTHIRVLRSATEADEAITCSISWASDEMRLITSPERLISNQAGPSRTTWANRSRRRVPTTRSPSHETR